MPTRKQRRRRAKEMRHEYVWEDEEGNIVESDEARDGDSERKPRQAARQGREPQAPSWRRTFKRGLIFAPIMFVTVMLLSSQLTLAEQVFQTLLIVAIFIPFSFLLDQVFWRSYRRRQARRETGSGRGG